MFLRFVRTPLSLSLSVTLSLSVPVCVCVYCLCLCGCLWFWLCMCVSVCVLECVSRFLNSCCSLLQCPPEALLLNTAKWLKDLSTNLKTFALQPYFQWRRRHSVSVSCSGGKTVCSVFVFVFVFPTRVRFIISTASYYTLCSKLIMFRTEIDLLSYFVIGSSTHLKTKKKTISTQLHTSRSTTKHKQPPFTETLVVWHTLRCRAYGVSDSLWSQRGLNLGSHWHSSLNCYSFMVLLTHHKLDSINLSFVASIADIPSYYKNAAYTKVSSVHTNKQPSILFLCACTSVVSLALIALHSRTGTSKFSIYFICSKLKQSSC